ncbi:curli-like amyloid fiber formation chaperone CsgH [Erythrobacter sp. R86502]|uniref:curli-like amyloid fiber formation chaperone CsgH n=1 Tax=Erythrobacter sp. R86502 TaxID=3093846 RepID=UPI0036D3C490
MTIFQLESLAALLVLTSGTAPTMKQDPQALSLDVKKRGDVVEVQLIGRSARSQEVSYSLEVVAQSTSRHRGKTTLIAGKTAVLSTMRATVGENWCVKLVAEELGREPYEVFEGSCEMD